MADDLRVAMAAVGRSLQRALQDAAGGAPQWLVRLEAAAKDASEAARVAQREKATKAATALLTIADELRAARRQSPSVAAEVLRRAHEQWMDARG